MGGPEILILITFKEVPIINIYIRCPFLRNGEVEGGGVSLSAGGTAAKVVGARKAPCFNKINTRQ